MVVLFLVTELLLNPLLNLHHKRMDHPHHLLQTHPLRAMVRPKYLARVTVRHLHPQQLRMEFQPKMFIHLRTTLHLLLHLTTLHLTTLHLKTLRPKHMEHHLLLIKITDLLPKITDPLPKTMDLHSILIRTNHQDLTVPDMNHQQITVILLSITIHPQPVTELLVL